MKNGWLYAWALGSVALGGASLIVPLHVVSLGGTPFTLGILASVAAFAGVPGALVVGRLADRTGKRRLYVLGALVLVVVMLLLMAAISSIPFVIFANGVLWFAFAAVTPVLTILAVSGHPIEDWSDRIAQVNKYQGVGWALGLLAGVIWTGLGSRFYSIETVYTMFFIGTAACAAGGLFLGIQYFPADPVGRGSSGTRVSGARIRRVLQRTNRLSVRMVLFPFTVPRMEFRGLRTRRLLDRFTRVLAIYFGAVFVVFTGFAAFFAPLPAFLTDVGFRSDEIFFLYLLSSVGSAVTFGTAGRIARSLDVSRFQGIGLLLRGGAFPIVAIVGLTLGASLLSLALSGVLLVLVGVAWAIIAVTAGTLVSRLAPMTVRGEALGVYAALGALAGGFGSILGGWIATMSYLVAFGAAGALVVLGAIIVLGLRRQPGYLE